MPSAIRPPFPFNININKSILFFPFPHLFLLCFAFDSLVADPNTLLEDHP